MTKKYVEADLSTRSAVQKSWISTISTDDVELDDLSHDVFHEDETVLEVLCEPDSPAKTNIAN